VFGWVGLGPNFSTWVGLGQSADGLGWIGSHKMDPWTTLVGTSCITNPQHIEVMELEFYDRPTCIKLGAFSHDASNVVRVVNKLDRRRRVLLTCRGDIFQVIAVATLSGNSLRQTVHTHRASVHQAEKLVAALVRVAGVTADLAESNDSPYRRTHITCRLTAKNRDQFGNPTLGSRVWATFTFFRIVGRKPPRQTSSRFYTDGQTDDDGKYSGSHRGAVTD